MTITQKQANDLYTRGNNAGHGYSPYTDDVADDSVSAAVEAAEEDGWEVELRPDNTSDVVVLSNADGDLLGIGGDGMGRGAWAVALSDERRNLVACCDVYRDGNLWVVLETGMPEDAVQIGIGETLREAYDSREGTPIQSTGRDSGRASALAWAHGQGWIGSPESLDSVDDPELPEES